MLSFNLDNAGQGFCDPVDAEGLRALIVRRRRHDDPAVLNFFNELAIDGVFHMQLILPVPLLCDFTGDRVSQSTNSIRGKIGLSCFKQNRFHPAPPFCLHHPPVWRNKHARIDPREIDLIASGVQFKKLTITQGKTVVEILPGVGQIDA